MSEERRSILQRVAAGELSPEEAAEQLDRLGAQPPTPPDPPTPPGPAPAPPAPGTTPPFEPVSEGQATRAEVPPEPQTGLAAGPARRVRVVRSLGATRIVGDPEVQEAVAEGPHRAERLPDELVIHSDFDEEGFSFNRVQGQWGRYRNARLNVRMRPELALEVQAQAASVQVQGVTGPISGDVQAGSLSIDGSRGPFDLTVQAGSLTIAGTLNQGTSRLRCEAGSVHVVLRAGSSVHIKTRSTLGYVSVPGEAGKVDDLVMGGGNREVTIGSGEAHLEIEATLGSIRITQE